MIDPGLFAELGRSLPERTGLLMAVAASGDSFGRSLMPRTVLGQAVATGLSGALAYGLVTTTESVLTAVVREAVQSAARRADGSLGDWDAARRARVERDVRLFVHGAHAAAAGAGLVVELLVPQRPGERLRRATLRTAAAGVRRTALGGAATAAVLDGLHRSRLPGCRGRALETGTVLATGVAVAAVRVYRQRRAAAEADTRAGTAAGFTPGSGAARTVEVIGDDRRDEATGRSAALAVGAGAGTAVSLVALARLQGAAARLVARGLDPITPERHQEVAAAVGHLVSLGLVVGGVFAVLDQVYRGTEQAGDAVESAYRTAPTAPTVSGGPASLVAWDTLSREGRRFTNMALTAAEIEQVAGGPARDAVRAFVGLDTAATPLDRALLLMDELDRLGAFDRSVICLCGPTGTGYVNYVVAETLEYLTRGDCATAAVQYSLRPSFLSLDRVRVGRENNVAVLTLLHRRLARRPADRRPRLLLLGESLGAHTTQDAFLHQGTDGLHRFDVDRALFVGTPDGSGWARQWRADPETADPHGEVVEVHSATAWDALPGQARARARYVLLTHDEDPIAKFGPEIAVQRPRWLSDGSRPPGVPPEMRWKAVQTFFVTLADVLNASNPVPGVFASLGHDYRADLVRATMAAFGLPAEEAVVDRVEQAVRSRELLWAQRRVVAEQVDKARAAIAGQLKAWDVSAPAQEHLERLLSLPAVDPLTGAVGTTAATVRP